MRSAVRREVSSSTTPLLPQELRSAGISVLLIQAPFAYPKKSSPGATDRSIPARSMPLRREGAAAWEAVLTLFGAAGEHASAGTRARAAQRARAETRNGRRPGFMGVTIGSSSNSRKEESTATLRSRGPTRVSRPDRRPRGWGVGGRGAEGRPIARAGQGLRLGEVLRCEGRARGLGAALRLRLPEDRLSRRGTFPRHPLLGRERRQRQARRRVRSAPRRDARRRREARVQRPDEERPRGSLRQAGLARHEAAFGREAPDVRAGPRLPEGTGRQGGSERSRGSAVRRLGKRSGRHPVLRSTSGEQVAEIPLRAGRPGRTALRRTQFPARSRALKMPLRTRAPCVQRV